jgi:O-antigen/teichoic acid export membrane protein
MTSLSSGVQTRARQLARAPSTIIFLSANIANAANLAFNMVFARLMGPDLFSDLALLLTLKLAALSLFSAMQFGFSKITALIHADEQRQADMVAGLSKLSLKVSIPVFFLLFAGVDGLARLLAMRDPMTLTLVLLIIPALVPISLYRGVAYGRIDVPRLVSSFQLEWVVRLLAGLALWFAGFGLLGVTLALVASVYIGALFASRKSDRTAWRRRQAHSASDGLLALQASAPFLAIQIAQILMLDGELFIAKAVLPGTEAGYLAGLGLIQRIFFFAFLSFAALLLPMVARKTADQDTVGARQDLSNMLAGLTILAIIPLTVLTLFSPFISALLFGEAFRPMAPWAPMAAMSALSFAIAHLAITYFVARDYTGRAYGFAGVAMVQFLALVLVASIWPSLAAIVTAKFFIMIAIAIGAIAMVART